MTKGMYDLEKITKEEFKAEARRGIYFFNSLWTEEINPLETVKDYILKIDDVKKYMKKGNYRVLENAGGNLRFKKGDGAYSYLTLDSNSTCHKIGNFLVVYTMYDKPTNQSIVMYIKKSVIEKKTIVIDPELFIKELPHGSGIDCSWEYKKHANGKVTFKNWYHAMDEHGVYDGYMSFAFTVFYDPIKNQFDFIRVKCNENKRKSFYGLKDYLEDILYAAIVGNIDVDKHVEVQDED